MKPTVYIETSIPSFYYEIRTEPILVAQKAWTREWWDHHRHDYILVTSEAVLEELVRGDYPNVPILVTPLEMLGDETI